VFKKILAGAGSAVFATGVLVGAFAPGAQAASNPCNSWALTKDVEFSVCISDKKTGNTVADVEGSYSGISATGSLYLYLNGSKAATYSFKGKSSFTHDYGWQYSGDKAKVCLTDTFGSGYCSPTVTLP
jgi:roadblock/LC7 domain-containing protein